MNFLNTLNRVVIVIVCLVLVAALTALFMLPQIVLSALGRWMMDWGTYFYGLNPWVRVGIGILLSIVVDLLLLAVIFVEVRSRRPRYIRVQQVAGGMANISIESVIELLQQRLDPLPGVIEVKPRIQAKGNHVSARVETSVTRDTNVPQISNQLIKTIQSVLTEELGLQIAGQPEVHVTVLQEEKAGPTPTPPAAVTEPPAAVSEPPAAVTEPPAAGTEPRPPALPEPETDDAEQETEDSEVTEPADADDEGTY